MPHLAHGAIAPALILLAALQGCGGSGGGSPSGTPAPAVAPVVLSAEIMAGQRLFLETRFAQAFKAHLDRGGTVNGALPAAQADVVLDTTQTTDPDQPLPGPFAGLTMNCRACHLVDEQAGNARGGMRTYNDFARRSPIPGRGDGRLATPRNSPTLVGVTLDRPEGVLFHYDGEFSSMEDVVVATLTGRNYGWVPAESTEAIAHVARVIREDEGRGELARQNGALPYRVLLAGESPDIPPALRLPAAYRLRAESNVDAAIVDAVARLVTAYVNHLRFAQRDAAGVPIRSPYDAFLALNGLPSQPDAGELTFDYSRRLRDLVLAKERAGTLRFVGANPNRADGAFQFHRHPFVFGPAELAGFKIFFTETEGDGPSPAELARGGVGFCHGCHRAPAFTDFKFHNTGVTQREYEAVHGAGSFAQLFIPTLEQRNAQPEAYLPATASHPGYRQPFRAAATPADPGLTDLGAWNILRNPDFPAPQAKLAALVCNRLQPCPLTDAQLLDRSVARFKTSMLRNLGHSGPYMHNGRFDSLEDAIAAYLTASDDARAGALRNGDPGLKFLALKPVDVAPLAAFLRSLDEDYQRDQQPDATAP